MMSKSGICRFCQKSSDGQDFWDWVKPTFTDHDKLSPGDIVCDDCLFWFDEANAELATKMDKDKPQRMRNYSHFILNGEWIPLSKGNKTKMTSLLLGNPFPELAAIAESGQKHIVFRATRNAPGSKAGWVQFEEQSLWIEPEQLRNLLEIIQALMVEFSKGEIETAQYKLYRIINFGLEQWRILEQELKPSRGSLIFNLALFLAQKPEEESDGRKSSRLTGNNLEGDQQRVQKSVSPDDMETVRGYGEGECVYQQPGQIHQLTLFEDGCTDSE